MHYRTVLITEMMKDSLQGGLHTHPERPVTTIVSPLKTPFSA